MDSIPGRFTVANMAVPSEDQVKGALSSCNGDEEEVVASLVKSSFLNNIYEGSSVDVRTTPQLKSLQLNEELSGLLTDESIPRDVSCYLKLIITVII